jgi:hypothetical protein
MDQDLRSLFDRTLRDEPPPQANLAQEAMVSGTRLRRRRGMVLGGGAAGVLTVFATLVAVSVGVPAEPAPRLTVQAAMARAASDDCTQVARSGAGEPVQSWQTTLPATDVAVFLAPGITDRQRGEVESELGSEEFVRNVVFESRQQAYAKFKKIFADDPELVNSVRADQLPESFRAQLAEPSRYAMVAAKIESMSGVAEVVGYRCPKNLPSREAK